MPGPQSHHPSDHPSRHRRILIGAMSGTSVDGVDAAAVEITGRGLDMQANYLGHVEHPYGPDLKKRIFALRESGSCRLDELARLGRQITQAYAGAVRALLEELSLEPSQVEAVAAHGQTLFHEVPDTIQWLDPSLLAAETGLTVISDFRRADLAAGGQGAPLVPFADWILFRHPKETRVILNIGGIANLTYLPAGGGIDDVIAFDTGPGNCISDWAMRELGDGSSFDEGGELASYARPSGTWGGKFLHAPYFGAQPPKSTDVPAMLALFQETERPVPQIMPRLGPLVERGVLTPERWRAANRAAAGCDLCGITIQRAMRRFLPQAPEEIFIAGGGARNATLVKRLKFYLTDDSSRTLLDVAEAGLPSQAREAVAFAVMGAATLDGEPSNVPSATGAKRRVVLGSITPRP